MTNKITLYCDGGGNNTTDRVGGVGVLLEYKGVRKMYQAGYQDTTNNRTELLGCIHGLSLIKRKDIPIELICDSYYVLGAFIEERYLFWEKRNLWRTKSGDEVLNKDLWQELLALWRTFEDVTFTKVKGHSGIWGNCMCDQLATEAIREVQATNEAFGIRERVPDEKIHYDLEFTKTGRIKKRK